MKKRMFAIALLFTAIFSANAESIDFVNQDGSAYRVTVSDGWGGRTTVRGDYVSRDQRVAEGVLVLVAKLWLALIRH